MITFKTEKKTYGLKRCTVLLTALVLLACFSVPAHALIYWSNRDGSTASFDWFDGGSDNGLFGDPDFSGGNTFVFYPQQFRAESINGNADITSDRMEVTLAAKPGHVITGIRITEYGDYGILSEGMVSASGSMFLTNLDHFDVKRSDFTSNPASPISSGTGNWSAEVAVGDLDWSNLKLVLDNNLMAISSPGSVSFIEKKVMGSAVSIEVIVPEPATMVFLSLGSMIFLRFKNKK